MRELTDFLLAWADRREPPLDPSTSPSPDSATIPLDPDSRVPLFAALKRIIAPTLTRPDDLDFEQLIHVCEQLGAIFPLPQPGPMLDRYRLLTAPFLAPSAAALHLNLPSLVFAAQDACYAILEHVSNCCDRVSSLAHPQASGLAALALRSRLRAFSLNYDDIPYSSGIDFYDGWVNGLFLPMYPWPTDRHTLCPLHGSILWGHHESAPFDLYKFENRQAAREHRNSRHGTTRRMDGTEGVDAPMITGLRKADRIMDRPYGTYFHVFRDELLRCPNWLIVGYGFRDPHVNQAIAQARSNWQQRGQRQRIMLIDYHNFERANEEGVEPARIGDGVSKCLERILASTFRDELREFHTPLAATVQRGEVSQITTELAVWLDGGEQAFTTGRDAVFGWLDD